MDTKRNTDKSKPSKLKGQAGRKPKKDPSVHRYTVNLNDEENVRFQSMLSRSGMENISRFMRYILLGKEIKVITTDKTTLDYYVRLTNFYHQFQTIGNNYNQTVRAIKSNFGEKTAYSMLARLEKTTLELVALNRKIIALTREYEEKYLDK